MTQDAKPVGLCPAREAIYRDCFDEIVRQVTVDCSERGELLNEVKLDIEERVSTLWKVFESSMAFALRKSHSAEMKKEELRQRKLSLQSSIESKKENLEKTEESFENLKHETLNKQGEEKQEHEQKVHELEQMNVQLRQNLEALAAPPIQEDEEDNDSVVE